MKNTFKKVISCLLSAALMTGAASATAVQVLTENTGIEVQAADQEGYEEIYTIDDLYNIGSNPTGKYILMNDIDLSETAPGGEWDFGNGWAGIPSFAGELDGNGHEIRNMHIFGNVSNAGFIITNTGLIKDLRFTDVDVNITSSCNFGTICCCYELDKTYGKISNCSVSGSIRVEGQGSCSVGGLVCYTRNLSQRSIQGRIVNSYNLADITVNSPKGAIGGIIGHLNSNISGNSEQTFYTSYVVNCYNKGNIAGNGDFRAGGIVGTDQGGIYHCANFKDGGIYGEIVQVPFTVSTENRFYTKYGTSTPKRYASNNVCESLVEQCYCLQNNTFGNGGTGLAAKQMTTAGAYSGWDFKDESKDGVWVSTSTGPQLKDNPEISAESIEIAQMPTKLNYKVGDDLEASGTITVTYSNGNTNTVNITKDMLSGYDMTQGGVQDVTVTYQGCQTAYEITVSSIPVTSVSISDSEIYLATGEIYKLTASVLPENATNKTLKWTTSDSSVATVSDGKVTAVGSGVAVITVKSNNNKSASCIVNVDWSDDDDVDPSAVSLNKTQLNLEKGKSETLTASILPQNATNKNITWRSSNSKIATVENGKVTGIAAGTTNILAITDNGLTASCTVTVTEAAQTTELKNNSEISSASVTANTELTLSGKAEGGTAPYKYAYYYKKSTDSSWTKLVTENGSAYVTASTQQFKPTSAGTYNIRINVKDQGGTGTAVSKEFTVTVKAAENIALINNSTVSAASVKANTEVTLNGKAEGGTSPYKYAYYYKKSTDSSWTKAYVTSSGSVYTKYDTMTFTPTTAGTYDVRINVKDEYGNGKVVSKDFKLTVTADTTALTNNSTVSATTVKAGTEVTMTGKATGGTSPYKYAYYYKKSTDSTWTKAYVTSSGSAYTKYDTMTFTPTTAGTYNVRINVKDKYGEGTVVSKDFKLTVTANSSALTNNSKVTATSVTAGTKITLNAKASGGTAPYKYAYYYKNSNDGAWSKLVMEDGSAYVDYESAKFTPKTAGTYYVRINVKDKDGAGTAVSKDFTITVK